MAAHYFGYRLSNLHGEGVNILPNGDALGITRLESMVLFARHMSQRSFQPEELRELVMERKVQTGWNEATISLAGGC